MAKKEEGPGVLRTILTIIGIISGVLSVLFVVFIFFVLITAIVGPPVSSGNVAVIPIKGVITHEGDYGVFAETGVSSQTIVSWIEDAEADPNIKAVVFDIDSPGGTPVASEEIMLAVRAMEKPNVALVRETGASGAYWVASASDKIYASRMSLLGSIGVVASYVEVAGTLERYNATYRSLTAGEFKDTGSPFKRLTPREEQMFERQLNVMHEYFIQSVAENRGLPEDKVRQIANGWIYLGQESLELGLIDEIGGEDEVVEDLEELLGEPVEAVEYYVPLGFFQQAFGVFKESSFEVGKGIGYAMTAPRARTTPAVYT